ncbi:hypothetical protein [Yersinia sp. Marseille-Q3913]|uniref:hypothetical protein n=1 Tax=Yersinia sp. Marseille-Q3913 TaxID=2830769 RepID=UPI00201279C7|nr:hypothetical protein [Yersinia sp. Marseille-Q3913]
MQLVRKKAPRGGFYRRLTEEERAAIHQVCGFRNVRFLTEKKLAEKVLLEMRQHELWFKCDCGSGDNVPLQTSVPIHRLYILTVSVPLMTINARCFVFIVVPMICQAVARGVLQGAKR